MEKKDKNLHIQRKIMYSTTIDYIQSHIDSKTGLMSEEYIEYRTCPVCNSPNQQEIFIKNGGRYVSCNECSMVFLNPVFKDEELIKYYKNNNSFQALAHEDEGDFYKSIYNLGIELIKSQGQFSSILDIGCSGGFFLDLAVTQEFVTHGLEINDKEFNIANKKKHKVWSVPIEQLDTSLKFDVITLWDVFEHIKNGIEYLINLKKRLNNNGIIFMQIPSSQSLAARILQEKCNVFDGLEHVNLYNLKTIDLIAKRAGFRLKCFRSVIPELGPINNYLSYEHPYFGSFSDKVFLNLFSEDFVLKNNLGYKFQIVLQPS